MWPFAKRKNSEAKVVNLESRVSRIPVNDFPVSPTAKLYPEQTLFAWNSIWGLNHPFRIRFYRFLRDSIPILNSALWTWTRLCASPSQVQIKGSDDPEMIKRAEAVIFDLDKRIYQPFNQKGSGIDALVVQFFNSLFTDGMVCGEIILSPSGIKLTDFISLIRPH